MDNEKLIYRYDNGIELHRGTNKVVRRMKKKNGTVVETVYPEVLWSALLDNGKLIDECEYMEEEEMLERHDLPYAPLKITSEGIENLVMGIVSSASREYQAIKCLDDNTPTKRSLELFFLSDWFTHLTGMDGRMILARLKDSYRCFGCPLFHLKDNECLAMHKETYQKANVNPHTERHEDCPLKRRL
jgi:hypothetical protein